MCERGAKEETATYRWKPLFFFVFLSLFSFPKLQLLRTVMITALDWRRKKEGMKKRKHVVKEVFPLFCLYLSCLSCLYGFFLSLLLLCRKRSSIIIISAFILIISPPHPPSYSSIHTHTERIVNTECVGILLLYDDCDMRLCVCVHVGTGGSKKEMIISPVMTTTTMMMVVVVAAFFLLAISGHGPLWAVINRHLVLVGQPTE